MLDVGGCVLQGLLRAHLCPACLPGCRRIDVHDALKVGLADHAAEESSAEEVALRVAREIAQVRGMAKSGESGVTIWAKASRREGAGLLVLIISAGHLCRAALWRCDSPSRLSAWGLSWTCTAA